MTRQTIVVAAVVVGILVIGGVAYAASGSSVPPQRSHGVNIAALSPGGTVNLSAVETHAQVLRNLANPLAAAETRKVTRGASSF